jgi:hypothetical protein
MDPPSQLLMVVEGGSHPLAQRVGPQVPEGLAPGWGPLCLTAGFNADRTALVAHGGSWRPPDRHRARGPRPKPRWLPLPAWLYAPVVPSDRWPGTPTI